MIIDFHTHMFPDKLAERTIVKLSEAADIKNHTNGTLLGTLQKMKECGVSKSVVCNIATNEKQTGNVNKFAVEINKNPEIISFGSVHPDCDFVYFLDFLRDNGIKGIKLHPDYQQFFIDDKKMQKVYENILKRDFVLIFHTGIDDGVEGPTHASPERIKNTLGTFRSEKVVFAHMGGFRMWDDVTEKLIGEDIYFDTSCTAGYMPPEKTEQLIIAHGTDKILFASDLPWTDPAEGIREIEQMKHLNSEEKMDIFFRNAEKLLNI